MATTSVTDFFNTDQINVGDATLPWTTPPPIGWYPQNFSRNLVPFPATNISGGQLHFNSTGSGNAQIIYFSNTFTVDLSNTPTITLINFISTGAAPGIVTLTLFDTVGNINDYDVGFVAGNNGDIIFDLSTPTLTTPTPADLSIIRMIRINIFSPLGVVIGTIDAIISQVICVAKDTMVLMANGNQKPIQNIQRGDLVAGDLQCHSKYQVAKLIQTPMSGQAPLKLVKMNKNAIAVDQPNSHLIISSCHPIYHNSVRRPARCFKKYPGVKYYGKIRANVILPIDDNNKTYSLYNLQFEHNGSFVANGLVVDSVPANSSLMPLPRELYFNKDLISEPAKISIPRLEKAILI